MSLKHAEGTHHFGESSHELSWTLFVEEFSVVSIANRRVLRELSVDCVRFRADIFEDRVIRILVNGLYLQQSLSQWNDVDA